MGQSAGSCCAEEQSQDTKKNVFRRGAPSSCCFQEDLPQPVEASDHSVNSPFTEDDVPHGPVCTEVSGLASVATVSPYRSWVAVKELKLSYHNGYI